MKGLYLILIILLYSIVFETQAQRSNGLTVEGVVTVEQGSVDGAVIEMYRNGQRMDDYGIGSNGRYRVELNYNNEFVLVFARKDNFPQKIVVDTHVSREVLQSDPLFPPFPVNVKLFTEIDGIDRTFSENVVMKIYYSGRVDNFISDLFYNEAQIKHLIDQAIVQSQQIGKEADFLAGLTKAEIAELRKEYDKLIKEAENEYKREEFLNALDGYKAANKIFPKEQYPKDRIAEINDLLGLLMVAEEMEQALTARLQALITRGDLQFEQKKYEDARASYQRALSVDAGHSHATARLSEIDDILTREQASRDYDALITAANNSFDELLYAEARNIYLKALELKSNEKYPQQKIVEIDEILKQQAFDAEKLQGYKESVFQAELNFEKQFYDKAISYYENALTHKPGDELAARKIEEIKALMNRLANQTLYDKRIKTADKAFKKEQYEEALVEYEEAAKLFSSEQYPLSQIKQINAIFTEQERLAAEAEADKARLAVEAEAAERARLAAVEAEKERQYNQAVSSGDSLFRLKDYENSRKAYQLALQYKPEENLPGERIVEIDELIVQMAAVQKDYDDAVARGNEALQRESYEEARAAYKESLQFKPEETHPKEMLAQIDSVEAAELARLSALEAEKARLAAEAEAAEQARLAALEAEREKLYAQAISRADSLFRLKEYENSRTAYQAALQIKPEEQLPGERIEEIDKLIVQLAEMQKVYDAAVTRGDDAFRQELFDVARAAYVEAQQAKPEETYPKEVLAQIDSVVETRERQAAEAEAERIRLAAEAEVAEQERLAALEVEKERQYKQEVSRADSMFKLEEYENAMAAYKAASQVKPDETLPEQRISEINELIGRIVAAQQAYSSAVARGDEAYLEESFPLAKTAYLEALKAKPEEIYPQEMLIKIDSIVEVREQLAAEAEAERLRLAAEAEAAELARLSALEAEKEQQYNRAVHSADSLFKLNEYENSLTAYQTALQIKPDENLPEQRIVELNGLMEKLATAQLAYDAALAKGDDSFKQESYEEARAAFIEAQQVKPEENYPKEMLAQIDSLEAAEVARLAALEAERARLAAEAEADEKARLLALEAEKELQYNKAITLADSLFNRKDYEGSRSAYQLAFKVNDESEYPQQRISEVDKILRDLEFARLEQVKIETEYRDAINAADKQFTANDYLQAKAGYELALGLKPNDAYPKDRIAEIDRLIKQLELEEKFSSLILAADGLFQQESWAEAKTEYENALRLKPDENYPKGQMVKIDNLLKQLESKALAEQKSAAEMERRRGEIERRQQTLQERQEMNDAGLNQLYQEYISLADGFFDTRNYNVSRAWYYKAWDLKQDEPYPQQRIDEINRLVGSLLLSQRDRDYQQFVDLADSTFRENQLAVSRGWYNRALTIKSSENYPKEQLQAIADLITERMAGVSGEQFDSHMKKGAEAFEKQNYNVARYWYKQALELRPDDKEAQEKLKEIQDALN